MDRSAGIHRLLYTAFDGTLAISSQMHALLRLPGIQRALDPAAVYELFSTGYILPPRSIAAGIAKLGPGECLTAVKGGRSQSRVLDRLHPGQASARSTPGGMEQKLLDSLDRNRGLPGKREYLLSGGIDSGVIVALATRLESDRIETVSGAFSGSELDESTHAKAIAMHYDCNQRLVELGARQNLQALARIVWHLGEPTLDFSVIPTYALLHSIAPRADVVFSGDGPDHLFGRYYPLAAKRRLAQNWLPFRSLRRALGSLSHAGPIRKICDSANGSLLDAYRSVFAYPAWGSSDLGSIQRLLAGIEIDQQSSSEYLSEWLIPDRFSSLEELVDGFTFTDFYVDGAFGVFQKVGALAAGLDLVIREPFLDRDLADYIVGLPLEHRTRGSRADYLRERALSKFELKHVLAPSLLPESVVHKTKGGFTPPLRSWLEETLAGKKARDWLPRAFQQTGLLDTRIVDQMAAEHGSGQRNWTVLLFMILSLGIWHQLFVAERPQEAPTWDLTDLGIGP